MLKSLFGVDYDDLWKAIIRPPKNEYIESDLGPKQFLIENKIYTRTDIELRNKKGHKIVCSHWEPKIRLAERLPCVVYLHGNCSSRLEAVSEAKILLPMNITLFALDFSGCGKSEGEYISLGWYEKEDVECVIEYLRKTNSVSTIGLWGRSMGAVTALMYSVTDPTIAGIVLDSPFSSLNLLVKELVKEKISLPDFIISSAISVVKSSVKKRAKFDLNDIEPINFAGSCFIPALFCHAKDDNFVKPHHSKKLFNVYQGEKNIISVDGDHNSVRPKYFKDSAAIFFYNSLQVEFLKQISDNFTGFIYKKEEKQGDSDKNYEVKVIEKKGREKLDKIIKEESKEVDKEGEVIYMEGVIYDNREVEKNLNNLNIQEEDADEAEFLKAIEESKKEFEKFEKQNKKDENK